MQSKAAQLGRRLRGDRPLLAVGAHDAIGARLAERTGFDAVWASSLEVSTAAGVPDAGILGMAEFLGAAAQINRATSLPVIADCDTGFGSALNVAHLVRRYEAEGIAAVCIEDKCFPKRNSYAQVPQVLVTIPEFQEKIRAATATRQSPSFLIIARTETFIAGLGLDEALVRTRAYVAAGADAILIHSKAETPNEVVSFLRSWDEGYPVFVVPTTYPDGTVQSLGAAGASAVIFANHGLRAEIKALDAVFRKLVRAGSIRAIETHIAPLEIVFALHEEGIPGPEPLPAGTQHRGVRALLPAPGAGLSEAIAVPPPGDVVSSLEPLLARQIEALCEADLDEVWVLGSLRPQHGAAVTRERIPGGLLANVFAAIAEATDDPAGYLVLSEDVILGGSVAARLIVDPGPIAVLVDSAHLHSGVRGPRLRCAAPRPPPSERLDRWARHRVTAFERGGEAVAPACGFVGATYLSPEGVDLFLRGYERFAERFKESPFGGSARFEDASWSDFLSVYVAEGGVVHAIEYPKGWIPVLDRAPPRRTTKAQR